MSDDNNNKKQSQNSENASLPGEEQSPSDENHDNGAGNKVAQNSSATDNPVASLLNDSLGEMMAGNFIEYASYVIKDRAIPDLDDGLKPVQRRILHALYQMDDGRFHKVANVIGNTMQYHPHGDASIGNALVVLANKEYFIEKQGNFGNILTGDEASAPRYIECRLTQLAHDVLFNKEITEFAPSYDGRKQEPVKLPAKIPVVLLLGAEGIAVGMSTRILPHNFKEVLQAQIAILEERPYTLYPDFLTGGIADVSEYENGNGRIKIRARIEIPDKKRLVIKELPATKTTESLISSIEESAKRGKIKIAGINDFTTDRPEIEIKLPRGVYAQDTIKQLYAYTDCEVSLSTSMVVIKDDTPEILSISDILEYCTDKLVDALKRELEIELDKLRESFHQKTLVQIFIEERIYKRIEEAVSYEKVLKEVRTGLEPYRDRLNRDITDEDIDKLLNVQIRRISRFDINKNQQDIDDILVKIETVKDNLNNLTPYTIDYLQDLISRYGDFYPRRTEIDELEEVSVRDVALKNIKVGHDKTGHFIGSEVRNSNKNQDYMVCTEYDKLIPLKNNGEFKVISVPRKEYVGPVKYLLKADKDQVYSMIYRDRKTGKHYAKRFKIDSYIMNREYKLIPDNCFIEYLYLSDIPLVRCEFQNKKAQPPSIELDFQNVPLRSRGARGVKISDRKISGFTLLKRENENNTNSPETGTNSPETGTYQPPRTRIDEDGTFTLSSSEGQT
ncbi:MAG: DNA topoisomerase IV subunit A [Verrucomicrobiota bacterium]